MRGRFELTGEARRIASSADQVNHLAPKLRRIGRTSMRHREHLLRKPDGLHEGGSTSAQRLAGFGAEIDLARSLVGEAAKAVPFRLKLPFRPVRQGINDPCLHRLGVKPEQEPRMLGRQAPDGSRKRPFGLAIFYPGF
jgi:hypothetical protein